MIVLHKVNKQFYIQLSYNQPYMNIIWETITRLNFGHHVPKKLRAKKWDKLYRHYLDKIENVEIDITKIEIERPSTQGLPNGFEWEFPCHLEFEDMQSTGCDQVKFCSKCSKHVYQIESNDIHQLHNAIKEGVCVAVTDRKGYQINGTWYDRKPQQTSKRPHTKSKWRYDGSNWIRI